jgi:ppGpp synthetase/RelA/SpoT-type nucleotidyltranferase
MATEISKTQIDRLGDRLRKGNITDSDLRLLDEYRRSFTAAYGVVAGGIRRQLDLEPTGRPAKSTTSIAEKLRRESIRLSQIQDIAGCRLIVSDTVEQDRVVASLVDLFPNNGVVDRRQTPSHGYRAVHVIAKVQQKGVEIQIRTTLQQLWAELSEKLSDVYDPAIKYGGGDESIKQVLTEASSAVAKLEKVELQLFKAQQHLSSRGSEVDLTEESGEATMNLQIKLTLLQESRQSIINLFQSVIEDPSGLLEEE